MQSQIYALLEGVRGGLEERNQDISITKPKKAYKKTSGLPDGLADQAVFYCVSCMNLPLAFAALMSRAISMWFCACTSKN
jgi:hypothetical protein